MGFRDCSTTPSSPYEPARFVIFSSSWARLRGRQYTSFRSDHFLPRWIPPGPLTGASCYGQLSHKGSGDTVTVHSLRSGSLVFQHYLTWTIVALSILNELSGSSQVWKGSGIGESSHIFMMPFTQTGLWFYAYSGVSKFSQGVCSN